MPLETGTWTINANGTLGQLVIAGVDPAGNVTGNIDIPGVMTFPIMGFWSEASQRIVFSLLSLSVSGPLNVAYTGFLFRDQLRMPGITGSIVFTLVGCFEAFQGSGGTPQKFLFGWYAQIGVG